MRLFCYSIFDLKASVFNTPFFFRSRGEAVRAFIDLANDNKSSISRHPEDYSLFEIGSWDDQSSTFESVAPVSLGIASSFVVKDVPVKFPPEVK